jgi:hypothetical protein
MQRINEFVEKNLFELLQSIGISADTAINFFIGNAENFVKLLLINKIIVFGRKSIRSIEKDCFKLNELLMNAVSISTEMLTKIKSYLRIVYCAISVAFLASSKQKLCEELFYGSFTKLCETYPEFVYVKSEKEQLWLLNFRNMIRLAMEIFPAKDNKGLLMAVAEILEGSGEHYITGGTPSPNTVRRVKIYEKEGNQIPRRKKPRIGSIVPAIAKNIQSDQEASDSNSKKRSFCGSSSGSEDSFLSKERKLHIITSSTGTATGNASFYQNSEDEKYQLSNEFDFDDCFINTITSEDDFEDMKFFICNDDAIDKETISDGLEIFD